MILSIIIPVYNEEKTIIEVIKRVSKIEIPNIKKEIIVVNDASSDKTAAKILNLRSEISNIKYFIHKENLGKGAAVRTGINNSTGEYIVIQDADTEYNPDDIIRLCAKLKKGENNVIYGTRLNRLPNFKSDEKIPLFLMHYLGNRFLSLIASVFYGQWITDMETCYKLFPRIAVKNMSLKSKGFEFEPEITAKLMKAGYEIKEIPITTTPRDYHEGKKLNALRDGPKALFALIKYRFIN